LILLDRCNAAWSVAIAGAFLPNYCTGDAESGVFMRFRLGFIHCVPIQMRELVRMKRIAGGILVLGSMMTSCTAPRGPMVVSDPDPSVKIPAIKIAVEHKDLSTARQMVSDLESDDAAVRFYAINGLRRLTGENFGYLYYEDAETRKPAVERWQAWLAQSDQTAKPDESESSTGVAATQP
jgi:hypothetical protein